MGYSRKPNYHFKSKNDTGIDKVPEGRVIIIEDYEGDDSNKVRQFIKKSNNNISENSTIEDFVLSSASEEALPAYMINDAQKSEASVWSSKKVFEESFYINKPSIILPVNGSTEVSIASTINSSVFSPDTNFVGKLTGIDYEVCTDNSFDSGNIKYSSLNSRILNNNYVKGLSPDTLYYARIRHISGSFCSDYSDIISFRTTSKGIDTPVISSPQDFFEDYLSLNGNAYNGFDHTETHLNTDWEVSTKEDFSDIAFSSYNDTVNLTSIVFNGLLPDSTYYIRARYKSDTYWSDYSEVFTIKTEEIFGLRIGIPGELGFGVGVKKNCPDYFTEMTGCKDVNSDNFGNYKTSNNSVFVFVPKFYFKWDHNNLLISDNDENGTYALHRAFINAGLEQDGFFISKYQISNDQNKCSSKKNTDPISTHSDHNPIANLTSCSENKYLSTYIAPKDFGPSFHTSALYQYNALALIAYAAGKAGQNGGICAYADVEPYLPKGCNNDALADHADTSVTFTGSGYSNCALTGSGEPFAKTTHNGQNCGIADVNGNMYMTAPGLVRPGSSSTATANDDNGTDSFYILKESFDIANLNEGWTDGESASNSAFGNEAYLQGSDSPYEALDIPQVTKSGGETYLGSGSNDVFGFSEDRNSTVYKISSLGLALDNGTDDTGTTEFGNDRIYEYHRENLTVLVSSDWNNTSVAGVFCVDLNNSRASSYASVGFRASSY